MNNIKVIALSLTIFIFLAASVHAQDDTKKKTNKTKTETKMEGCSDTQKSCCSTTEKSTSVSKPFNEVCPVLGNKVSANVKTIEYKGKSYGFCCPGCDDKFQQDPEKYIGNLSSDGKTFIKGKS